METPKGNHLQGSNLEMDGRSGMLQSATWRATLALCKI